MRTAGCARARPDQGALRPRRRRGASQAGPGRASLAAGSTVARCRKAETLKIQIATDLHIESWRGAMPDEQAFGPAEGRDQVVLAGDIHVGTGARCFIEHELARSPVAYVLGNHEHYGPMAHDALEEAWTLIAGATPGLHFLNRSAATIGGVRLWGCTWYSGSGARRQSWQGRPSSAGSWTSARPATTAATGRVGRHLEAHRRETEAMRREAGSVGVVVTRWPPTLHALHRRPARLRFLS